MASPPYVTQADLEKRFTRQRVAQIFSIQQSDGSDSGAVDSDTLAAIIADASAEFDSILLTVFTTLTQVGGLWDSTIVECVSVFVMYRGTSQLRVEYAANGTKLSPYEKDYLAAVKRVKEIKAGERRLAGLNGVTTQVPANTGGENTSENPSGIRPFRYFWPSPDGSENSGSNGNGF